MKRFLKLALAILASTASLAWAQSNMSDAEVRRIDRPGNRITLRHGEIKNLDMPAMTMVFQVKDPALLERVKEGDKIKFKAEKVGTVFTITEILLAP